MAKSGPRIMISLDLSLLNMVMMIKLQTTSLENANKDIVIDKYKYGRHVQVYI
jgi:hypothetical protein